MSRKRWSWLAGLTVLGILTGLWIWRFRITQDYYDTMNVEKQIQYHDMAQFWRNEV